MSRRMSKGSHYLTRILDKETIPRILWDRHVEGRGADRAAKWRKYDEPRNFYRKIGGGDAFPPLLWFTKRKSIHYGSAAGASMLTKREPSRPTHFEYCLIFGARTTSCSTVLRGEPVQRRTRRWRASANDPIRPPAIANLKHTLSSLFFIS